jgi:rubrerythrin
MEEVTKEAISPGTPEGEAITRVRLEYSRGAPPVGTMPPPASLKGAAKTAVDTIKGNKPLVLLDLLGERAAFERTGTRLYDALLVKLEAADAHPGGPTRPQLERIRDEEIQHFQLVKEAIESLGGDPTVMTPSADIMGVASMGWPQVLTDPRTTLNESLKVILAAELVDNDGWLTLIDVAQGMGHDDLAAGFRRALAQEEEHLALVRGWLNTAVAGEAGLETPREGPPMGAPGGPIP